MLWIGLVSLALGYFLLYLEWEAIGGLVFFIGLVCVGAAFGVDWDQVSVNGGCPPFTC